MEPEASGAANGRPTIYDVAEAAGVSPSTWLCRGGLEQLNPVQPDSAILAIRATIGLLPAVCALIAMLILAKYPLNDKFFEQIRNESETRKHDRQVATDAAIANTASDGEKDDKPPVSAISPGADL